jgi:tetratricopeptide (TPR) repeat protein
MPQHLSAISSPAAGPKKANRSLAVRTGFIVVAIGVAVWGIRHNPALHEKELSRLSLSDLQAAVKANPADPDARYHLGRRLNAAGRYAEAADDLKAAAELDPARAGTREEWMQALLALRRPTDAYAELKQFTDAYPRSSEAHRLLGQFLLSQHSLENANKELTLATECDASNRVAWTLLAAARDEIADAQGAIVAESKAISLNGASAADHLYLGTLLERTNNAPAAREQFETALRLNPRMAEAHRELANWLLAHTAQPGDLDRAEAEATQATTLNPNDGASQEALGEALMRKGKKTQAISPLESAARLSPDDPSPARHLWDAYAQTGNQAQAARWQQTYLDRQSYAVKKRELVQAIEVHPTDRKLNHDLANLLAQHGDAEGCLRQFASALGQTPDSPEVLDTAATALAAGRFTDSALVFARQAALTAGSSAAAHETYARVLVAAGHTSEAREEFTKAANGDVRLIAEYSKMLPAMAAAQPEAISPAEAAFRSAVQMESGAIGPKHITSQVEKLAQQAASLEPTSPKYLGYLLHVQVARRYTEQAIETAKKILTLAPDDVNANLLLGVMLIDRAATGEQLAEAEHHLRAVSQLSDADSATQHYGLGLVALKRHDTHTAIAELKESYRLDPQADVTLFKLAQAENMAGDTHAADACNAEYQKRQAFKRSLAAVLGDIAQHPQDRKYYDRAIEFLRTHGMTGQAEAVHHAEVERLHLKPAG